MIGATLLLVGLAVTSLYLYSRYRHSYWSSRGVQTPPYYPIVGHTPKVLNNKIGRWVYDDEVYRQYGGSHFCGLYEFMKPTVMVGDPELLRCILMKDFDHFVDRRSFKSPNKNDEIMNGILSNENGDKWKNLRAIVSPTFSSGKMRSMFPLVCDKADALVSFSLQEAAEKPYVDMQFNFGRFTMDTIASCAFGIECNSLVDKEAIFAKQASLFFNFSFYQMCKIILFGIFPTFGRLIKMQIFPKQVVFFKEVVDETIKARKKGNKRGDFLDLLLEAQSMDSTKSSKITLDDASIVSQCILFIIAGYDTTASTLGFASYLLAKHPDEQKRLYQEVQEIIEKHGDLNYQDIMEAKFLDSCIMETLRLYPPGPITERVCTKDYSLPGTNITIKPGDVVQIPIWSIHHDEKHWPEPHAFKPDRFMPENKANIRNYTHLPFGLGPRNCIAMRFALMEAKVALAKLVLAADLKIAPGHEELTLSKGTRTLRPVEGVNLILTPRGEE